jgi:hypothetical protein
MRMDSPPRPDDVRTAAALFRVPPEQFTAARNHLAAELRRAGKASDATALAKLPRPTPVVWAINQVAHRDRAAVDRLVAAADRLKRAQLGREAADVPTSTKAYQDAVATLVEQSLVHLTEAGRATTAATRNRLTGTLMAAATDPGLRDELRAGQLSREQIVAGFDVFGDARPPLRVVQPSGAPRPGKRQAASPSPPLKDPEATRRRAEARVRLETARADLAQAESRARELAKTAAERAKEAAAARERAVAADRAAAEGRADVTRARAKIAAVEKATRDHSTD